MKKNIPYTIGYSLENCLWYFDIWDISWKHLATLKDFLFKKFLIFQPWKDPRIKFLGVTSNSWWPLLLFFIPQRRKENKIVTSFDPNRSPPTPNLSVLGIKIVYFTKPFTIHWNFNLKRSYLIDRKFSKYTYLKSLFVISSIVQVTSHPYSHIYTNSDSFFYNFLFYFII